LGAAALAFAVAAAGARDALTHFVVYLVVIGFFKGRDAVRRLPALVAQAKTGGTLGVPGPRWLRTARLLVGYDPWTRSQRMAILVVCVVVCTLFGWDDGGPFAAAILIALAAVNACFGLVALGVRAATRRAA
jgi:hypothetical protein